MRYLRRTLSRGSTDGRRESVKESKERSKTSLQ